MRNLPHHGPRMRSLCDFAALPDNTLSASLSTWNPELCVACMQPPWLEHPVTGSSSFCEICCILLTLKPLPLRRQVPMLTQVTGAKNLLSAYTPVGDLLFAPQLQTALVGPTQQIPLLSCDWAIPLSMRSDPLLS